MCHFMLVAILGLCLIQGGQAARCIHSCNKANLRKVIIGGMELDCDQTNLLQCNIHYGITTNNQKEEKCYPCVENICFHNFGCGSTVSQEVTLTDSGVKLNCPSNFECNWRGDLQCSPCVQKKCTAEEFKKIDWKCDKLNPRKVTNIITNQETYCSIGYVCNNNNNQPCQACIPQDKRSVAYVDALRVLANYKV